MTVAQSVPLLASDAEVAADVLVRSFVDDPGLHFILPSLPDRDRLSPSLARTVVRYTLRCGSPLVTPVEIRGVALWFAPGSPAPSTADLTDTGIVAIPDQLGPEAWVRCQRLLDPLDELHRHLVPDPHWYLAMLGVDPAWQRQGIGEALMRPVFAAADREGTRCYLEAPTADNARYYERRGFRVVGETDVPDSHVHIWLMRRDPTPIVEHGSSESQSGSQWS